MLKDIYIIKNNINNKVYIGQAINAQKRFISHKSRAKTNSDNSPIHYAMNKYGIENFYMEILESQIENYNEREQYWIQEYNSLTPNGYNILKGGDEPPYHKGETHHNTNLTQEQVDNLIEELCHSNKPMSQITKDYNINYRILRHINYGEAWYNNEYKYPLKLNDDRNFFENQSEEVFLIKKLLQKSSCSMEQIGKYFGTNRKTIERINSGKTHNYLSTSYPIRTKRCKSKESVEEALIRLEKEELNV